MSTTKINTDVLASKGIYQMSVGVSVTDGTACYVIINTETGVQEVETRVLPQAYQYLRDLDIGLTDAVNDYNDVPTITPPIQLAPAISEIH